MFVSKSQLYEAVYVFLLSKYIQNMQPYASFSIETMNCHTTNGNKHKLYKDLINKTINITYQTAIQLGIDVKYLKYTTNIYNTFLSKGNDPNPNANPNSNPNANPNAIVLPTFNDNSETLLFIGNFLNFAYNYTSKSNYFGSLFTNQDDFVFKKNLAGVCATLGFLQWQHDKTLRNDNKLIEMPGAINNINDYMQGQTARAMSIFANLTWRQAEIYNAVFNYDKNTKYEDNKSPIDRLKYSIFLLDQFCLVHSFEEQQLKCKTLSNPNLKVDMFKDVVQILGAQILLHAIEEGSVNINIQLSEWQNIIGSDEWNTGVIFKDIKYIKIMKNLRTKYQELTQAKQGSAKKTIYKRTTQKVQFGNRQAIVYQGPRGGKYVKKNGKYVSVKSIVD